MPRARPVARCLLGLFLAVLALAATGACTPEPPPPQFAHRDDPISVRLAMLDDLASELESAMDAGQSPDEVLQVLADWLAEHGAEYAMVAKMVDDASEAELAMRMVRFDDDVFDLTRRMIALRAAIEASIADDSPRLRRFRSLARQLDA